MSSIRNTYCSNFFRGMQEVIGEGSRMGKDGNLGQAHRAPEGDNDRSQGQLAIQTASGLREKEGVASSCGKHELLEPWNWKKPEQATRGLPRLRNIYIYSCIFSARATACIRTVSRKRNENSTQKFLNAGLIDDIYQTDWMIISIRGSEDFAQGNGSRHGIRMAFDTVPT